MRTIRQLAWVLLVLFVVSFALEEADARKRRRKKRRRRRPPAAKVVEPKEEQKKAQEEAEAKEQGDEAQSEESSAEAEKDATGATPAEADADADADKDAGAATPAEADADSDASAATPADADADASVEMPGDAVEPASAEADAAGADATATVDAATSATDSATKVAGSGGEVESSVLGAEAESNEVIEAQTIESSAEVTEEQAVVSASVQKKQAEVFPISVGLEVGASFSQIVSDLGTSVAGNLEVAYLLPWLDQRISVFGSVGYGQPVHRDTDSDPRLLDDTYNYKITERELTLALGPMVRLFPPKTQLNFYGQIGPQVRLQNAKAQGKSISDFGANEETATEVGVMLAGGAEYALGPGALAAELVFSIADLDHRVTGESTSGGLTLQVGYHFLF